VDLQPNSLKEILHAIHEVGRFEAVFLASQDGLLIATEPANYDPEITAATVALLRKVSSSTRLQLGMAELDEVTIRSHDHVRLVCRYLSIGGQGLILVVIVPPGHYYRRATSRAIKQIERLLT
jgi:predicted regulator of Ras-like GTPase activity (Roadblock/LC7/MglB family)